MSKVYDTLTLCLCLFIQTACAYKKNAVEDFLMSNVSSFTIV